MNTPFALRCLALALILQVTTHAAPGTEAASTTSAPSAPGAPVRLTGANGKEVDFAGIWEARPEGLVVVTTAESPTATVPWDRFDLPALARAQPVIEAARQRAVFLRTAQPLNLGLFNGLLTAAQAGEELRRSLDVSLTLKVPQRFRTTTTSTTSSAIVQNRPVIYDGLVLPPQPLTDAVVEQSRRTVSETKVSPEEITTSPRRVITLLSRTDGVAMQDRRDVLELVRANPAVLGDVAATMERIAVSLPPKHLLPNEPTMLSLASRLREYATTLQTLSVASVVHYADQLKLRDLLLLADNPRLR